jgi:hypothetical protein
MRNILWLLLAVIPMGCRSVGQPPIRNNAPDIRKVHPAPGTRLIRFQEIDEGVYKGSKPKTDADYEFLQSKGVKYIVQLRLFPWLNFAEKRKARKFGMTLLTGTVSASPVEPSKKHIDAVLCFLRDKRYHPIYLHCDLGRDRAMLIVGLYEMYYKGKSKQDAYTEMKYYGFHGGWGLAGLTNYFEHHSQQPVSQYLPHCVPRPLQATATGGQVIEMEAMDFDEIADAAEACQGPEGEGN